MSARTHLIWRGVPMCGAHRKSTTTTAPADVDCTRCQKRMKAEGVEAEHVPRTTATFRLADVAPPPQPAPKRVSVDSLRTFVRESFTSDDELERALAAQVAYALGCYDTSKRTVRLQPFGSDS